MLHLSIVVRDLDESRAFYADTLGCRVGRSRTEWMDVWFYGLQLTLQHQPQSVVPLEEQGNRHFGVTIDRDAFAALTDHLEADPSVRWVVPVSTDHPGTEREQTKCKLADPSGNVIELKTYRDPSAAFAPD